MSKVKNLRGNDYVMAVRAINNFCEEEHNEVISVMKTRRNMEEDTKGKTPVRRKRGKE